MADNNINIKISKPTTGSNPSPMGKKIDNGFQSKMKSVAGVNMKSIKENNILLNEKEESLKKKIFSLPKMETLIATDDYLHGIYEKMKVNAAEVFGYHWNETLNNVIFNDYVLNDTAYLQKYKNTVPIKKKRRGEEGKQELEKAVQDKIDNKKASGEKPTFGRKEKVSDIKSNDSLVDRAKNQLGMEKNAENEVAEQMKSMAETLDREEQEMNELFGFGSKPTELISPDKASKLDSYYVDTKKNMAVGVILANPTHDANIDKQNADSAAKNQAGVSSGQYKIMQWQDAIDNHVTGVPPTTKDGGNAQQAQQAQQQGRQEYQQKYGNVSLAEAEVDETTGSGSSGAFAVALDSASAGEEVKTDSTYNNKEIYQNETTSSASSGQFSGPAIWAKNPEQSRWAHKPAWKGGEILAESKDYMTNPDMFKKYVQLVECYDKIEKVLNENLTESETAKQHALRMLKLLNQAKAEYPELASILQNDINAAMQQANTPEAPAAVPAKPQFKPQAEPTSQWKQPVAPMKEHHLHTKDDKIDFILQHTYDDASDSAKYSIDQLKGMDDAAIEHLYLDTEKKIGMTESVKKNEGLFKDKWNMNEAVDEKAESKAQQRFMGMVHAAQKGELENPSPAVAKAAASMTDKDAEDFASTKHKGLPNHVKEGGGAWSTSPKAGDGSDTSNSFEDFEKVYHDNNFAELKKMLMNIVKSGQVRDLRLYLDGTGQGGEIKDWLIDNIANMNEESMLDDKEDSMARTMDSDETNTSGQPMGGGSGVAESLEDEYTDDELDQKANMKYDPATNAVKKANPTSLHAEVPRTNKNTEMDALDADAQKFRDFLKSKYGVESVAELSPMQKQQVMKDIQANKEKETQPIVPAPQFNFGGLAKDSSEYKARDAKQLGFVAQHDKFIKNLEDFEKMEKLYKHEMGEKMFHPMAILASIQAIKDPNERAKYANVEKVLTSRMKGGAMDESKQSAKTLKKQDNMNEERMTPSMLNLQKINKETAALTKKDMADADALKQAKVYPNPDEFYIEQDKDKIQEFKSGEELEAEALKKLEDKKKALLNVGNSTNDKGDEIIKRNLTKEEKLELAMNRGDGMHNIVYDNEPSKRFEKRMEKDMGADQYKLRQEKMKYKEDMPSFNRDTTPVDTGEKKEQFDKFKKGFNTEAGFKNEAFTGKYVDGFGKVRLVEFQLEDTKEVTSVEGGFKLSIDGLGNKYTQKINESKVYADVSSQYDFYLVDNAVVRIKPQTDRKNEAKNVAGNVLENSMDRMSHLINYKAGEFINSKKSVKF